MNRPQFYRWMEAPAEMDAGNLGELEQIVERFPYFQTARTLYLLQLKAQQDLRFSEELRRCAAHAPDRAILRRMINATAPLQRTGVEQPATSDGRERIRLLEEQINQGMEELAQKKLELDRLIEEKNELTADKRGEIAVKEASGFRLRSLPKDDLLEEFIRERSLQTTTRATFFSPEESARRSIEENYGVLSETLARLVAAQGHIDKAIKIYQQLMLKNPQKSSYFAAQIEKLRKEL